MRARNIPVLGLVFNGPADRDLEDFVEKRTKIPILLRVKEHEDLTRELVSSYAEKLNEALCGRLA